MSNRLFCRYSVIAIDHKLASNVVVSRHYLRRKPPISHAFGLYAGDSLVGVVTYGTPPSRHLQKSACPSNPNLVLELNRLWVHDACPRNTESWFVSRTLRSLPARIVVSYADPVYGHIGYVYRALNFYYAGWTDMERKTPRFDYLPADPKVHTRDAFRNGYVSKRRRIAKVKYWTVSGTGKEKAVVSKLCPWPRHNWKLLPPPNLVEPVASIASEAS